MYVTITTTARVTTSRGAQEYTCPPIYHSIIMRSTVGLTFIPPVRNA